MDSLYCLMFCRTLVIVLPCYGALEIVGVIIIIFGCYALPSTDCCRRSYAKFYCD